MNTTGISRKAAVVAAFLVIGMLSGCAGKVSLDPKIKAVEENIAAANAVEAETYAPDVMRSAESKLAEAKSAANREDYSGALRLLDEAMSDADYAKIKAPTEKAKKEVEELRGAIKKLRDEIKRMTAAD